MTSLYLVDLILVTISLDTDYTDFKDSSLKICCPPPRFCHTLSVDHESTGRGPKTGVRAYARTPVFGYSFNFREVLTLPMKVARFEFAPALQALLHRDQRGEGVEMRFQGAQSVKHLIESLGIPHTEIGPLTANKKSIGLDLHRP